MRRVLKQKVQSSPATLCERLRFIPAKTMSAFIPPEQTVCLKSVPHSMLERVLDAIKKCETRAKLGVRFVSDKDTACAGKLLVYANYTFFMRYVQWLMHVRFWLYVFGILRKPEEGISESGHLRTGNSNLSVLFIYYWNGESES